MDNVGLGRTGLTVSVAGLGSGGFSQLGVGYGRSEKECIEVVLRALDLGVTYFDTAPNYDTEAIVGQGLRGRRAEVTVSTKVSPHQPGGGLIDASGVRRSVQESLRHLECDVIDVFHLHGVAPEFYDYSRAELVAELYALRDEGLIRFLAVSERFQADTAHEMLRSALADDWPDVIMVGFNLVNPGARHTVLPMAVERDVGVEVMFAVRHALANPDELRALVAELVRDGYVPADAVDPDDPLGFLVHELGAESVVDAAYRFARHEPGCHVVLTGTGDVTHLEANVASLNRPALPDADRAELERLFGSVGHVTAGGTAPRRRRPS